MRENKIYFTAEEIKTMRDMDYNFDDYFSQFVMNNCRDGYLPGEVG